MNPEIESLMSQYLDGRVSADEAAELAKILAGNPEAAARFAELTRVDEGLRTALKAESRSQVFASRLRSNAESSSVKKPVPDRRRWLAAAAGLAVLGGTAWWFSRDGAVPEVVMDWARSRVKRSGGGDDNSGGGLTADLQSSLPVDKAAELRRKLRGFAIPYLHMRSMALSDAVNTLNRQWTDLPHRDPEDAKQMKINLADSARKRWPTQDKEPLVSVDIPNISLHTALSLIAAQAGLQMEVAADAVTLTPDGNSSRDGGSDEKKTWTFPLAKPVADTFLASVTPPPQVQQFNPQNWAMNYMTAGTGNEPASLGRVQVFAERLETADASKALSASGIAAAVSQEQAVTLNFASRGNMNGRGAQHWIGRMGDAEVNVNVAGVAGATGSASDPAVTVTGRLNPNEGVTVHGVQIQAALDGAVRLTEAQEYAGLPSLAQTEAVAEEKQVVEGLSYGVENSFIEVGAASESAQVANSATYNFQLSAGTAGAAQGALPESITSRYLAVQPTVLTWFENPGPAPTLESWLTGLNGGSMTHDTENGIVSVTGSPGELRTASAAIAALSESAQAGVSVETRVVRLGGNEEPDFLSGLDDAGKAVPVSAEKVDRFCKSAAEKGISIVRVASAQGRRNQALTFALDGSSRPAAERPVILAGLPVVPQDTVVMGKPVATSTSVGVADSGPMAEITADKSGEQWTIRGQLPDGSAAGRRGIGFAASEGSWVAVRGAEPGNFLLMRFRSVAVQL